MKKEPVKDKVVEALARSRSSWLTTAMIAERLGIAHGTAAKALLHCYVHNRVQRRARADEEANSYEWRTAS